MKKVAKINEELLTSLKECSIAWQRIVKVLKSQEAFKALSFKSHSYLKLTNVAYIMEALALSGVLNLLEYVQ